MNRKGTEKPIEIFVALFIILAVALVMLKLFQSQISEKQKELADVEQEQKSKELRGKVELACQEKCTQASNNDCSLASLASLCIYGSHNVLDSNEFIDLDNDKVNGYDYTLLAGIGVCEDHLYCFHLMSSCCARQITPGSCADILNQYWTQQGLVDGTLGDLQSQLASIVPPGSCTVTPERWDQQDEWTDPIAN